MNWKQRAAKLLSVFFMGYGGGFTAVLPTNYFLDVPLDLHIIVLTPIIAGLGMMWPQVGKMFGDMADGN